MPLKLTLSEVVLRTSDLARLATFYERLLEERRVRDLTPTYPPSRRRADAPTRMRFIPLDPQRSFGGDMLAIFECEGAGPGAAPPSAGLHHFQMRLESLPELFDTFVRMRAAGYLPATVQNHGLGTSFYYLDPDGNRVELNARNFGSIEAEEKYAATPEFAANPSGHEIDADAIVARHAAGECPPPCSRDFRP